MPLCRIGPYVIGLVTGYAVVEHIKHRYPIKQKWSNLALLVAAILCLTSLYITFHAHLSKFEFATYQASFRMVWATGLCIIILVCAVGNGGPLTEVLSTPMFIPFSRLTYGAYLLHPVVLTCFYKNFKSAFEFSHPMMLCVFGASLVYVYLLSLISSLLFESPFVNLEKLPKSSSQS